MSISLITPPKRGKKIRVAVTVDLISPFPAYSFPLVWDWMSRFRRSVADDFGPETLEDFVALRLAMREQNLEITWGVRANGELGGIITFQRINPVTGYAHALFKKVFWGQHITIPALKQAANIIFGMGYHKIAMTPFADNMAIRHLLKTLGAHEEGILKAQSVRGGQPVSIVHYGLFPEDIER